MPHVAKTHQPLYRQILRQAWILTLRNKQLMILGFFATFISNVGVYDILLRGVGGAVNQGALRSWASSDSSLGAKAISIPLALLEVGGKMVVVLPVLLFVALLCAFLIWLGVISHGGIIYAASKAVRGLKFKLQDALAAGRAYFWPLLATIAAAKALTALLLLGISYPVSLAVGSNKILPIILYFTLFLLLVPAALIVSFLGLFSGVGIVTKKMPLGLAIKTSWEQFQKHWLVSLEMAFIILGLGIVVAATMMLAVLTLSVPFIVLAVIAGLLAGKIGVSFVFLIALTIFFAIVILTGSAFTVFQISAWTLLYLRFLEHGAVAKIVRVFSLMPKYLTLKKR